ncbi:cobalamin-binding protein [Anaerosalibacter massiliensis]|uniref:Cobalamin-binding protein n=1 Tax=Anaerosalibacter massiliensis TaxID=1347392 RepID=A0A9X2MHF2_9FIRM|nr:cobalamin-binding protein [Anaerosalibacter massiliensis]MCR2043135.1 cobalamin-binding protein [Anaerosalibacter massiliensis]
MKNIRNKKIIILLTLILTLTTVVGCENSNKIEDNKESKTKIENSAYPLEIEDQFNNKVKIEKEPKRIVSLAPSHTEILYSLGLGDKIVGVTSFCDYPEEAKEKDKIGDFEGVNIEKIIELEPDLVVQYGKGNEEVNNKIKEAGIPIVSYEPESIDEVIDTINEIGKITGKEDEAKKVTEDMKSKKEEVLNKVKNVEKVKVFYEIWHDPLSAAGPGSFMDELINLSGGENIAKDAKGGYSEFNEEELIERNPDVYLAAEDPEKTVESIKSRAGYDAMNAVKNNRVYLLEPNIVSRPGPRIVEALELVAKTLHPDLFK